MEQGLDRSGSAGSHSGPRETLYERDGITLEGTVRMVARDAATCQVREDDAHHAGNDGKPLHVWRLDYGAFNRSGNPLSQLTAHFQIEAEWPPCTNWTGLGQYPGPVQWAGSFETLQRTGGLEAGGEARETLYVLAIDGQQPRFSRWQLDFRFGETAASSEPAPANPPAPVRPPGPPRPVCDDTFDQWDDPPCWLELAESIRTAKCGTRITRRTSRFPGAEAASRAGPVAGELRLELLSGSGNTTTAVRRRRRRWDTVRRMRAGART